MAEQRPYSLSLPAAERITPERVRSYVEHLAAEVEASTVATTVGFLYDGVRLIAPDQDWTWLKALKGRLQARAKPKDRFEFLVAAHRTLDLAFRLMDDSLARQLDGRREREVLFRDGLILAVLSLWPIRRRSLAALTVDRHLGLHDEGAELHLFPEDTKSKRHESWAVPEAVVPYLRRYLDDIRPRLLRGTDHGGLWISQRGSALPGDRIYMAVRERTRNAFGKPMALHDFRRAAATFLAMDAPEKVGLTAGVLQHTTAETGDRHYNLARTMRASRRHGGAVSDLRDRLRVER